jgi:2TM domain
MTDTRQQVPRFSPEEAGDIIREATRRTLSPGEGERPLTREDLLAMANEMGISASAVEQVLAARARRQRLEQRQRAARRGLAWHATSYGIVIGGLTLLDVTTLPGIWVHLPAIGWGIGLAFHIASVLFGRARAAREP